jgi:hypothetical protein
MRRSLPVTVYCVSVSNSITERGALSTPFPFSRQTHRRNGGHAHPPRQCSARAHLAAICNASHVTYAHLPPNQHVAAGSAQLITNRICMCHGESRCTHRVLHNLWQGYVIPHPFDPSFHPPVISRIQHHSVSGTDAQPSFISVNSSSARHVPTAY